MLKSRMIKRISVLAFFLPFLVLTTACQAKDKTIKECGWFVNPVPNEVTFITKSESWIISQQGAHEAAGDWPEFSDKEWMANNSGFHGYGCACMTLQVDPATHLVLQIKSAKSKSLNYCRGTLKLPLPSE